MKCTRRNFIVAVTHTQILKINFSPSLLDPDKIKFQSYSRDLLELSCVIGIIYPSALKNFQSYTRTHARMRVQTHTTMVRKKKNPFKLCICYGCPNENTISIHPWFGKCVRECANYYFSLFRHLITILCSFLHCDSCYLQFLKAAV